MANGLKWIGTFLLVVQAAACAHYPVNDQSKTFDPENGYRFDVLPHGPRNTDDLFVCLMFSGGGTRAATLSYGIMQELRNTRIKVKGEEKSLLDEVDCISSVSGGSFTAAYYGLFRDRLFEDFQTRFLDRDIQGALVAKLFNPYNLVRVMSTKFGRIDLAAELYDDDIFDAALFSKLEQQGRPFIILNASNLGPGRRFDFTQQHFDAIGSRLDQYKVARAVAASSAFPFFLSAVSLKNWPLAEGYQPPSFCTQNTLKSKDWTSRQYNAARNLEFYLNKENGYIHLMDGGLSDNIGAQAILDAYDREFIRRRINQGAIKHLVFIVVNARTENEDKLSKKEAPPGLITVAGKTATVAMDNYSFESVERLRSTLGERVQNQKNLDECDALIKEVCDKPSPLFSFSENIDPYVVEINFKAVSQIPDEDPHYYLNLPTSFKLDKEQIGKLIGIGPKLLRASPMYQCLLNVLAAESAGAPRPENCPVGAGLWGKVGSKLE